MRIYHVPPLVIITDCDEDELFTCNEITNSAIKPIDNKLSTSVKSYINFSFYTFSKTTCVICCTLSLIYYTEAWNTSEI